MRGAAQEKHIPVTPRGRPTLNTLKRPPTWKEAEAHAPAGSHKSRGPGSGGLLGRKSWEGSPASAGSHVGLSPEAPGSFVGPKPWIPSLVAESPPSAEGITSVTLKCSKRQRPQVQLGQRFIILLCSTQSSPVVLGPCEGHTGPALGGPSGCQALSWVFSDAISVNHQDIHHLREKGENLGAVTL